MGDPQPAVPAIPPRMEVGYNYPWAFGQYGSHIGPRDLNNDPPLGTNSEVAVFRNLQTHPPEGSLAKNLTFLRDELKIKKVRMFLLCNAWNYGKMPLVPKGVFFVPDLHPLFLKHFREMLEVFAAKDMQILPSLVDFGALYELDAFDLTTRTFAGQGAGRTDIALRGRQKFLNTVLRPFLDISKEPALRKTIFAWEVINEPRWNLLELTLPLLTFFTKRPHTRTKGQDLDPQQMSVFIRDALNMIESDFPSTVGHRFLADLNSGMPTGTKPQFHYYALQAPAIIQFAVPGDPERIPDFASLQGGAKGAFIGEIHSATDRPWADCEGRDTTQRSAAFERLKVLAKKRYELVFLWPDGGPPGADAQDALKLVPDTIESIKQFTGGLFPDGVP